MTALAKCRFGFNGNTLKIIAAVTMTIDHIGHLFFPGQTAWRIIGRIAMPIYAFMVAEGCCHSRNKLRYFLMMLGLGLLCQPIYPTFAGTWAMSIPVNYAMSILMFMLLEQAVKERSLPWGILFVMSLIPAYHISETLKIDYGFWGCLLPVFCAIPPLLGRKERWLQVLALGIGLICLCQDSSKVQWWSLMALPLLLLYNGNRGKLPLKYFFYVFYPLHLAVLTGLALLLR